MALEYGKPQRMSVRGGARFQRQYAGHEVTEYTDDLRVMSSGSPVVAGHHNAMESHRNLKHDQDFPASSCSRFVLDITFFQIAMAPSGHRAD